jgi:5-hydroxyisourate hydrolase
MAIISTHTLNSVDGTHAGGIEVSIIHLSNDQVRTTLFVGETDAGGRFVHDMAVSDVDVNADHELVLKVGRYFDGRDLGDPGGRALTDVVVRFRMPDPRGRYHMPFMLAPNSYNMWMSR